MTFTQMVHVLPRRLVRWRTRLNGAGSDFNSYMTTPAYAQRLQDELADIALPFCAQNLSAARAVSPQEVRTIIREFFERYPRKPVANNAGGSALHNCFWLFLATRILNPSLIVESGVWKGQSSWMLRQACPNASMYCFDLTFRKLVYKEAAIQYHEMDWESFSFQAVDPKASLCFFDDHVNQAKRVREAYDKGFRLLLFDDNLPVHKLYSDGLPGVPTIDMLFDKGIQPNDLIEWVFKGQKRSYIYKQEDEYSAKSLIKKYAVFPNFASLIRVGLGSFLSLVELIE